MTQNLASTVSFQAESFDDVREEIAPLLEAHYLEIAHYQDIPLCVDWEAYARLAFAGNLKIFTVRDPGGLRGYAVFMLHHSLHYATSLMAVQDVLYLDPRFRKLHLGMQFIGYCDEALRHLGVQVVHHHVKRAHDFGPLLAQLGYEDVEAIWSRRLDKPGGGRPQ